MRFSTCPHIKCVPPPYSKDLFNMLSSSLPQFLVQRDADLFAENENRETPCDCAEKQHHKELALCLESQMVFSLAPEAEGIEAEYAALDRREVQNIFRCTSIRTVIQFCSVALIQNRNS